MLGNPPAPCHFNGYLQLCVAVPESWRADWYPLVHKTYQSKGPPSFALFQEFTTVFWSLPRIYLSVWRRLFDFTLVCSSLLYISLRNVDILNLYLMVLLCRHEKMSCKIGFPKSFFSKIGFSRINFTKIDFSQIVLFKNLFYQNRFPRSLFMCSARLCHCVRSGTSGTPSASRCCILDVERAPCAMSCVRNLLCKNITNQ